MSRWEVRSLKDVAAFFGVALDTARRDWRAAGMPGEPGKWDLSAIARWRIEKSDARRKDSMPTPPRVNGDVATSSNSPTASDAWQDPQFANHWEQWRGRKLKNDSLSGQIVLRDDVARDAAELLAGLRDGLENFPEKLAGELPFEQRGELRRRLEQLVAIELNHLADEIEHRFIACAIREPVANGAGEPPPEAKTVAGGMARTICDDAGGKAL